MTGDALSGFVDVYRPRGGSLELFKFVRKALLEGGQYEILHDGPRGTGKSLAWLMMIAWLCEEFPGVRVLMARKTRASMTETTLATFENFVLPRRHPARQGPTRSGRRFYDWPNGSRVIVLGLDDPEKIKSLEFDFAYVNEATEATLNDWETMIGCLRGTVLPAKIAGADCNPDHPQHWLIKRVNSGVMTRFPSRHVDNPRYWDRERNDWTKEGRSYVLGTLNNLSGIRRRRLLNGEWCASEGQIYDMFDPGVHIVDPKDVPRYNPNPNRMRGEKPWNFDWTLITIDWGKRNPGVLQAWGIIGHRAYRFIEIYRVGNRFLREGYGLELASEEERKDGEYPVQAWWADRACEIAEMYNPVAIVCDTDRPKAIRLLRDRIASKGGRVSVPVRPVEKRAFGARKGWVLDGIDLVQERLLPSKEDGKPSLYLVRGALVYPDPDLRAAEKPTCTEEEIVDYVWRQSIDGRPIAEEPDPTCPNHGCDAMRYMACYVWGKDYKGSHSRMYDDDFDEVNAMSPIEKICKWTFLETDG